MEDKIKIANCGCGGKGKVLKITEKDYFITCSNCHTDSGIYSTETEAIQAWNKAMGAKDINVPNKFATDTNVGNKTAKFKQDGEFLRCEKCNHIVDSGYKYCPNCGCRLEFE